MCPARPPHPCAIAAPARSDLRDRAQRATGGWNWPDDVLAFYEWCDGTARTPEGYLFPGLRPLSLDEVVTSWRGYLRALSPDWPAEVDGLPEHRRELFFNQLAADVVGAAPGESPDRAPAGSTAGSFVPAFLPVAEDQSGSTLVVDRRGKDRHGCVVLFDEVDADVDAPGWDDLLHLAEETARPCGRGHRYPGPAVDPAPSVAG